MTTQRWLAIAVLVACKSSTPPPTVDPPAPQADAAALTTPTDAAAAAPADAAATPGDAAVAITPAPVPTGPARVAVIHGPELLGSEQKALDRWKQELAATRPRGALVDADADEAAVARAYLADDPPATPPPLPAAWSDAPVVVVVELLPPVGQKPRRLSGGVAGLVIFRPPALEPVLIRRVLPGATTLGLDGAGTWIATSLTVVAASPP